MKKKVLKAVKYIAAVCFMFGACCADSEDIYIQIALCMAISLLLCVIVDHIERRYNQGGYIKPEPMVEAVIPHNQMNRVFANYNLSKDKN